MNETLEAMAQAIFRDWFVDFGPTRGRYGETDPSSHGRGCHRSRRREQLADLFPATMGEDGLPEGWKEGLRRFTSTLSDWRKVRPESEQNFLT